MLNVELGQKKKIPKFHMTIFSERESSKRPKFYKNAQTFYIVAQIQQKLHYFWIVLINTFRVICNLIGFAEVGILPLFW